MSHSRYFYRDLVAGQKGLAALFGEPSAFRQVPTDWAVVMLDVAGSTAAVSAGFHHEVNLTATGGIVAVLNVVHAADPDLEVPYFFGGDGATFLLPTEVLDDVLEVLDQYQLQVARTMQLTLKVGAHSVAKARAKGHDVRLAKVLVNGQLTLPVVLGTGVKYAEGIIKAVLDHRQEDLEPQGVNLEGMECRWDEVAPPRAQEKVICLLVDCPDEALQAESYSRVAGQIDAIFGVHELRQPISGAKLKLDLAISKTRREMMLRLERFSFYALLREWAVTLFGPIYFRYSKAGRAYLKQVVALCHTLMLDGTFNAVLTGTPQQIVELEAFLFEEEAKGRLQFGLHVTHASLMSCYVLDREHDHAHFVDGTEGGFTSAAKALKAKRAGVLG